MTAAFDQAREEPSISLAQRVKALGFTHEVLPSKRVRVYDGNRKEVMTGSLDEVRAWVVMKELLHNG